MPFHATSLVDRLQQSSAGDVSTLPPGLPGVARRERGADGCYIVLRSVLFLGSSYLMALGLPLLFFLLVSGGDAVVFFAQLANFADRFLDADPGRQLGFLGEFKLVLIGIATIVVIGRLPCFIRDLERALSEETA